MAVPRQISRTAFDFSTALTFLHIPGTPPMTTTASWARPIWQKRFQERCVLELRQSRKPNGQLLHHRGFSGHASAPRHQSKFIPGSTTIAPTSRPYHQQIENSVRSRSIYQRSPAKAVPRANCSTHPSIVTSAKYLSIVFNGELLQFDNIFLRDACSCPQCLDTSTRQKLFQTSDILPAITPRHVALDAEGTMTVQWAHDIPSYPPEHTSRYHKEFFHTFSSHRSRIRSRYNDQRQILWDSQTMTSAVSWFDHDAYLSDDETFFRALQQLSHYGLIFLHNVPDSESAVEAIAHRIGPLRNTFYGPTWSVRSIPQAKNVAYTSQHLGPHMDLLYFANPPAFQLLHCLRNSAASGGESQFIDSFRAATHLRLNSPQLFNSLTSFPVTYHYRNDGQHYHHTRPTVELEAHSYQTRPRIAHVNYSPPFQAPFEVTTAGDPQHAGKFRQYHAAIRAFAQLIQAEEAVYEARLEPGQCVIFNNRRVLHARRAFELGSGERWLKGAYVDGDPFASQLRVYSQMFKGHWLEQHGADAVGGDEYI